MRSVTDRAYTSAITVTNISQTFTYNMAAKINWNMERLMRHSHPMYTFDYSEPFITATLGSIRPSVCPISTAAAACGGFTAERSAGTRY